MSETFNSIKDLPYANRKLTYVDVSVTFNSIKDLHGSIVGFKIYEEKTKTFNSIKDLLLRQSRTGSLMTSLLSIL